MRDPRHRRGRRHRPGRHPRPLRPRPRGRRPRPGAGARGLHRQLAHGRLRRPRRGDGGLRGRAPRRRRPPRRPPGRGVAADVADLARRHHRRPARRDGRAPGLPDRLRVVQPRRRPHPAPRPGPRRRCPATPSPAPTRSTASARSPPRRCCRCTPTATPSTPSPAGSAPSSTSPPPAARCRPGSRTTTACGWSRRRSPHPSPGFAVLYGISANTRAWWDLEPGRQLGYEPLDDAEAFADRIPRASRGRGRGGVRRRAVSRSRTSSGPRSATDAADGHSARGRRRRRLLRSHWGMRPPPSGRWTAASTRRPGWSSTRDRPTSPSASRPPASPTCCAGSEVATGLGRGRSRSPDRRCRRPTAGWSSPSTAWRCSSTCRVASSRANRGGAALDRRDAGAASTSPATGRRAQHGHLHDGLALARPARRRARSLAARASWRRSAPRPTRWPLTWATVHTDPPPEAFVHDDGTGRHRPDRLGRCPAGAGALRRGLRGDVPRRAASTRPPSSTPTGPTGRSAPTSCGTSTPSDGSGRPSRAPTSPGGWPPTTSPAGSSGPTTRRGSTTPGAASPRSASGTAERPGLPSGRADACRLPAPLPVKSMGGEALEAVRLDVRGLEGDRWYAVEDADGHFASGKSTRRFRRRDPVFDLRRRHGRRGRRRRHRRGRRRVDGRRPGPRRGPDSADGRGRAGHPRGRPSRTRTWARCRWSGRRRWRGAPSGGTSSRILAGCGSTSSSRPRSRSSRRPGSAARSPAGRRGSGWSSVSRGAAWSTSTRTVPRHTDGWLRPLAAERDSCLAVYADVVLRRG